MMHHAEQPKYSTRQLEIHVFLKGQVVQNFLYNVQIFFLLLPWQKEVILLPALVCLFVCLSVCKEHYLKSYKWIVMKFYVWVRGGTMKN